MREFNTSVIQMFKFRITALFYCFQAIKKGYDVKVSNTGNELFSVTGRYSVKLSDESEDKKQGGE